MHLTFERLPANQVDLVRQWLDKPHVAEFFRGQGLQNTLDDLAKWEAGQPTWLSHWIALADGVPFGYLMTSTIDLPLESDDYLAQWIDEQPAITLDLLIGEPNYLGQGLGVRMIREFLKGFPDVKWIYIDPTVANERAVHVYEKAGFTKLGQFIAPWHPVLHWQMRLDMKHLPA